ncbi:probable glutathione S-transferase 6 [Physella acuta]|uniref:probable glutathione S-transferase 6 n=1 Tax=Physella acuta TaxID=109671 RepID=UPI0027DAC371|nr:probable glutathione S-transferase 6 [Physella acuta]
MLALAGVKYEDIRYTFQTWPAEKSKMSFGQLPVLNIDGKMFGQSLAIAAYIAKEAGFYPKNEAKKIVLAKELKVVDVPKYLDLFEKLLKESGTGYFVGTTLTLADFFIYDIISVTIDRGVLSTYKHPY